MKDSRSKAYRPGPFSPYMRRKAAQGTPAQRLLQPTRDYSPNNLTVLREFMHDFRKENGGRCAAAPPKGPHHQFYRLPEHQQAAAQVYYDQLCRKWAKRIRKAPNFARVLHMITLNRFKNPGQAAAASFRGTRMFTVRRATRRKLERAIYEAPQHSRAAGKITYLPTF